MADNKDLIQWMNADQQSRQRLGLPGQAAPTGLVPAEAITQLMIAAKQSQAVFVELARDALWLRDIVARSPTMSMLTTGFPLGDLYEGMRRYSESLAYIVNNAQAYRNISDSVAVFLQGDWTWPFANFRRLKKALRQQLLGAFLRARLWPLPSMPSDLIDRIAELAETSSVQYLLLVVWRYYARDNHAELKRMVAAWWDDPEYAARRKVIEDALDVHSTRKQYTLSIPALLIAVEGIARDFVRQDMLNGAASSAPKPGSPKAMVEYAVREAGNAGVPDLDDADILHAVLVEAVLEHVRTVAYAQTDFANEYDAIKKSRSLNRHGILHGIQIDYATPMNSLRCFFLLDALHTLRKHAAKMRAPVASGAAIP